MIGFLVAAAGLISATNHWVANTSGTKEGHINNFIEDMSVWYNPDPQGQEQPLVLVGSYWDEGGCGYCSYHDGEQVGKAEWWRQHIHSKWIARGNDTCRIENFWGRAFLNKNAPPPTGNKAPKVVCTTGDTIRSVEDPTAVAFDMTGKLLVADNGPDQNIKIFDLTGAGSRLVRTFGDSGGVFAGPIPGKAGTRRFWGIRGVGVDSSGNVYVGNTGMPMQVMGGTDIRVFSGVDSSLMWQVQGLSFVNNADADPISNGEDLYLNAKRFKMDYTQPAGKSWKLESVTLDPFKYPQDFRIGSALESVWIRRIQGKKFQYMTNMYAGYIYVVRFEENSEIGIPTAFFNTYYNMDTSGVDTTFGALLWLRDSIPTWERNETNKRMRWYWVDRNGDAIPQKSEFGIYDNYNIYSQSLDVDENGDIWNGGTGLVSSEFRAGGVMRIVAGSLNQYGVPAFDMQNIQRYDIPFTENNGQAIRIKHLVQNDVMYLATSPNSWYSNAIYRYDHFTSPGQRTQRYRIDLGFDNQGQANIHLDQNTHDMTLPFSFTANDKYIYVGYLDNGRYSRVRGEVTIYDAQDGSLVGWLKPGAETGYFAGTIDLPIGLNSVTQSNGQEVVLVEEDGAGKVMVYTWCPEDAACNSTTGIKVNSHFRKAPQKSMFNLLGQKLKATP